MKPTVIIGKIGLDILTLEQLHGLIYEAILSNKKKTILNINARLVELAHTSEKWLIDYVKKTDHVFCDGASIQFAAKVTKQPIPQKITYNVWLWQLATFCSNNNFSIFLLGGSQNVSELAIKRLQNFSPGLKVSGHHGFFNKTPNNNENRQVLSEINAYKPNILLVCFGMPMQEFWLLENRELLSCNIFLTGGGALDYISGKVRTTPPIFSKLYLEWFYRLCQNPTRLWRRYLFGNARFAFILFKDMVKIN